MEESVNTTLELFKNLVGIKFQLYNSLFTALPFHRVEKTGALLSLFLMHCEESMDKKMSPAEMIEGFVNQYTSYHNEKDKVDLLFRFIQYAERQVVLFDALEDAAFNKIHDMNGTGTLKHLAAETSDTQMEETLNEKLQDFEVRLVLTAHPTQFYPGAVLGIIHDLSKALIKENTSEVNAFLRQLGKTPFLKKEKPTPYDEAISLIWFLENVFYKSAGKIIAALKKQFPKTYNPKNPVIRMGFWPGGDRDGNPFVHVDTTIKVADELRGGIIKCYYLEVRRLKRRLTFKGVENVLAQMETQLYNNLFVPDYKFDLSKEEILDKLKGIKETLISRHNGLFVYMVDNLISKVELFGLFFASLDIRQDSSVHHQLMQEVAEKTDALPDNYNTLSDQEKIKALLKVNKSIDPEVFDNDLLKDTVKVVKAVRDIQQLNGEEGCNRYIISHSTTALDILEVYSLFALGGWNQQELTIDIVPLFETVNDLENASSVMKQLYENEIYSKHLQRRNKVQTIMVGFSDGTKDGGYLMANWSIYKAKEQLTKVSKEYGIKVVFFDGRGGPPARGGGKTHQFYASMGPNISNKEIQLTIQGQTVSSNFGTPDSAQFNLEQLIHAGISNDLFASRKVPLKKEEEELLQALSEESYKSYNELKNHDAFIDYLNDVSPLRYYGKTNIGSRPSKRNSSDKLNLDDLRAVPYVGSWSQLKQNVPGYYGLGTAMEKLTKEGKGEELKDLYKHSLFFRTLMDNCEMAMKKSCFPLTIFLADDPKYGSLWKMIHEEFERTKKYLLEISGAGELMGNYPVDKLSIEMRERIVLPLVAIQQFALTKVRELENDPEKNNKEVYENLVIRCSFGIINAGRNSA